MTARTTGPAALIDQGEASLEELEALGAQDAAEDAAERELDAQARARDGERGSQTTAAVPPIAAAGVSEAPAARAHHYTDLGNAERLVDRHGGKLRYCFSWQRWLFWDGRRWVPDDMGGAEALLKETLRALLADAHELDDDGARRKLLRHVLDSERAARIRGALDLARSEHGIPIVPAQFDTDPWLLNVANGTVNLRTGTLRPHRREDLITKLAPVSFDPNAKAPLWLKFLRHVLPDADSRRFLQRYVGYALVGITVEQLLAILYGGGANGKTTTVETLLELVGDYAQQAPAETFLERRETIPNDVARLRGARLVSASEFDEGRRLNETLVKRMTGGDRLTARFMRGEWFEFTPTFTVLLATNHKPIVRGTDEAIWRRIRLVPFSVTIPPAERDPELRDKLREEFPGILRWAVLGCLDWQRHGLGTSGAVDQATAAYREDSDLLGDFLAERCVLDAAASAKAGDLYGCYVDWCQENHSQPLSQQAFGRRLSERDLEQRRTGGARWWTGIGIRDRKDGDGS